MQFKIYKSKYFNFTQNMFKYIIFGWMLTLLKINQILMYYITKTTYYNLINKSLIYVRVLK